MPRILAAWFGSGGRTGVHARSSVWVHFALLAAGLSAAGCSQRQNDADTQMNFLNVEKPSGSLEADFESHKQRRANGSEDTTTRERIIQEKLNLNTSGSLIHPNFVYFTAGGAMGFTQDHYQQNDLITNDNGQLLNYDLTADILKEKKYPGHLYAGRSDQLTPRQFSPSLQTQRDGYGGTWRWADEDNPMMLSFDRMASTEQEHAFSGEQNHSDRWTGAWSGTFNLDRLGELTAEYSHTQTQEDVLNTNFDSDEVNLRHEISFDENDRYHLTSRTRYFDQQGTPFAREADAGTLFNIQHLQNFSTNYGVDIQQRDRFGMSQDYSDVHAGFRHVLFESLTTTGRVHAGEEHFSTGINSDRQGGSLQFDYRKEDSLGTLMLGLGVNYESIASTGTTASLFVSRERHTLSAGTPSLLVHNNVDQASIVISDVAGTTFYAPNLDYTATQVGTATEIRRVLGGRIDENQEVLVDYTYKQFGGRNDDQFTRTYSARHAFFFGLTPYVRLRQKDDTITPRNSDNIEDDQRVLTLGAEQELGDLTLTAEWEDAKTSLAPYRSTRYGAVYRAGNVGKLTDTVAADYTQFSYLPPIGRETDVASMRNILDWQLTTALQWEHTFELRYEDDSVNNVTRSMVNRTGLTWSYRALRFGMSAEHAVIDSSSSGMNESVSFMLNLKRVF